MEPQGFRFLRALEVLSNFLFVVLGAICVASLSSTASAEVSNPGNNSNARIVSLAPSITEILFALELEEQIVGVTRFCDYPAAASGIAKIGGFSDPNFEAIVALKPSIVFGMSEHQALGRKP